MAFVLGLVASLGISVQPAGAYDPAGTRRLTVQLLNGGQVHSSPSGISCGKDPMLGPLPEEVCSFDFPYGTAVTLYVNPGRGSELFGWSGGCDDAANPCVVRVDRDMTVAPGIKSSDMTEPPPEPEGIELRMTVGKAKLDPDRGTAELPVRLDDLAYLTLRGRGVRTVKRFNNAFKLPVRPRRATRRKLDRRGSARIALTIRAHSNAGGWASRSLVLRLVKR